MKRKILAFVGCLSLVATTVKPVQASYLNGYDYAKVANKKVVVTKEMKVYCVKTGTCQGENVFYLIATDTYVKVSKADDGRKRKRKQKERRHKRLAKADHF